MRFLPCLLLLASVCHGAHVTLVGATSSNASVSTNSLRANISLEDGVAVSFSQTDSQISLSPFGDDWAAIGEGTLLGDLTVVSGSSNLVSVLFGDADDPALAIESAGRWAVLPPGAFAPAQTASCFSPVQTNRLTFVLRTTGERARIDTRSFSSCSTADLPPAAWHWSSSAHHPDHWQTLSLVLAGPEARILDLRLKWRPEGTLFFLR